MSGPGMQLVGEEEKKEVLEALEAEYLHRYDNPEEPAFNAKVHKLEQEVDGCESYVPTDEASQRPNEEHLDIVCR